MPAFAAATDYASLVAKAEQGETEMDFTALRLAYAESDGYDPYGARIVAADSEAWAAFKAEDCAKVLAKSDEILKLDYTRISAHILRQDCLKRTGDEAGATHEFEIAKELALSLLTSGDGKSEKTAIVVVTLNEEDFALAHFGVSKDKQTLVNDNGRQYDVIEGVQSSSGEKAAVWFDATYLFEGMQRQLERDPAPH